MKNLGKYLYIIPIAVFGLMHMTSASQMTGMVPDWMPMKLVIVYITGEFHLAAAHGFYPSRYRALERHRVILRREFVRVPALRVVVYDRSGTARRAHDEPIGR